MDAESVEAGDKNHLNNVLSETEIANLPNGVANKINTYIDTKFEEYMTSKALLETSKTQIDDKITAAEATILELKSKYEVTSKKFQIADETVAELEKQVGTLTADLNKANEKIVQLENEIISLKNARDAAVDERNDLTHILERRNAKIEMLIANETSLSEQLRAAIDSKCEALTLNNDIQSKELALQYREKRMEQERVLLNTQIASLTEEVNSLTSELQTHRLNNTSRLVGLEAELSKKTEELKSANDTIEQLNEMKKKLTDRAENLSQRLVEQRDIEKKITENYKTELEAKTKLADLLKTMHDDSEAKATELSEGISELQKLLNEATEKYGELETKYKQAEKDHEELMEKKNEVISSLKNELEHANDLIKAAAAQNLDMALSDLAPSAATASKLLKSGMSLTQIYSQLVKVTDDLSREKEENRRLTTTINNIVQELEERAPMLQKQRAEYEETLDCNSALSQQIELLTIECNRLRDDYNEASRLSNHYNRENVKLKGELADLGRQVCFLLKEIEHSRGGLLNGDHDASHAESNTSNASDNNSSRIMSKTLVTFSDIQELQSNNQKLLRMIRELTDKQEELEKHKEQFETGEMQNKIDSLKTRISELTEAQDRQTKMVTESRLDEATRECSAIRMRLQEEQNRFRELASHLERQTETAKERMEEEKKAADVMRKEITILRNDLSEKNKANEELARKLKEALDPNVDNTLESLKKIKELENKISDKDGEIKSLTDQLNNAKEHVKQYCDISEGAEKGIKSLSDEYDTYKTATEIKLAEYSQKVQQLEEKCSELEAELSLQNNGEYASININLKNELANCKQELAVALSNLESNRTDLESARAEITKLSEAVQKAEDKYTHEMILHSSDIQTLAQTKEELSRVQNELNELVALKNQTLEKLEVEKASWLERQKSLTKENEELVQRFKDICEQNSVLHDQIQALGTQLSVAHASRSHSESLNESANDSNMSVSVNEDDAKSSEQMYRIVKFLRKEKDIALAKFDILQAETMRLRSQLEITEKQLDEAKLTLAAEREKYEVSLVTVNRQSDILRKVETLDALTDSNRVLREERDTLASRVEELTKATKALEEQLHPLQESVADLTSKNETLQSENTSLKSDCARWRTRVNALVERANKTSPEDWKRLQNERETLAKMLTNEKEALKKVNEELGALKIEKTKLEEQYTILSRQQNQLVEENKKLNEEVQTLKDDMARLTEELTKIKAAHDNLSETNVKLLEDLNDKDASLSDIRNKELQIRKIAKKYKGQYEELVKTVDEDKKKSEGEAAAAGVALAETSKKMEDQLSDLQGQVQGEKASNEKLKQELETLRTANMDREEKAKQVLKQAKSKIVQLTESKNSLSREVDELRSKIGAIEQSTREELEVRIALLKSQYDGRLSRLEKEKTEVQTEKTREVEALLQKVNMLQRQLANQSSTGKQQATTEKVTSDPPTANIKPMAGVAQQSVTASRRGGETPLASIRPMAQVGPTAPHDAHTTEYMPASSSRPLQRAALAPAASASASATSAVAATSASASAPPESTQDMDTSEAGMGSSGSSDNNAQSSSHSQAPQQVCGGVSNASHRGAERRERCDHSQRRVVPGVSTSHAAPGVSTSHAAPGVSTSQAVPGVSTSNAPPGVSTSHPPTETRPAKRRLQARPVSSKRTRVQGFERSVEVEYQVPTSSRCDQDDEGVIVVDSEEDDERCTGTMYREAEDDEEDMEEEQEEEGGEEEEAEGDDGENAATQDSPAQSPEAGGAGEEGDDGEDGEEVEGREAGGAAADAAREADSEPAPHHPQIEAISSGTEPSGALSLGGSGGDDGDDSIVPSTPTLYVPRRNDGFGEAVVSPLGAGGDAEAAGGARFTFAEGAASHHDTHADLAAALPPPHAAHAPQPHTARSHTDRRSEGTESQWEESRAEEEAAAVSSQGSEPSSPQQPPQIAEEGREAEASSPAPVLGTRRPAHSPAVHSPHQRWMRAAGTFTILCLSKLSPWSSLKTHQESALAVNKALLNEM
ncbi:Nucleoprotein TPR [Papilio xuthus]|uniref:Nucleoprotein TPR n=1 Tax=Papilio xuthus TaxID=66420 RepID=A0A194PWI6_PAPXU|nr:Nucleoprotein TPR [Papilio xuthus]